MRCKPCEMVPDLCNYASSNEGRDTRGRGDGQVAIPAIPIFCLQVSRLYKLTTRPPFHTGFPCNPVIAGGTFAGEEGYEAAF